jgi:hypothetical protein
MRAKDDPFDIAALRINPTNPSLQPKAFDLNKFKSTRGAAANGEMLAIVPRKIQKRRQQFVMVPWTWIERLVKARYIATYRVALHVLYQHWKRNGQPFTLANGAMVKEGVSRQRKWEALDELEQLGLITIERRRRKTPQITVLV